MSPGFFLCPTYGLCTAKKECRTFSLPKVLHSSERHAVYIIPRSIFPPVSRAPNVGTACMRCHPFPIKSLCSSLPAVPLSRSGSSFLPVQNTALYSYEGRTTDQWFFYLYPLPIRSVDGNRPLQVPVCKYGDRNLRQLTAVCLYFQAHGIRSESIQ